MIARAAAIARATPTLLRVGLASAVAYRAEFLIWVLTTTLPLVMLALWSAAVQDGQAIGRFQQADFVAYYLAALIVRQLTGAWVVWELNMEIRQGTLPLRMLRPIHPLYSFAAESLAAIPLRAILALPLAVTLLVSIGPKYVAHDPVRLAMLPFALLGAWLLQFVTMAAIGTLGMFIESSISVFEVWWGLFAVLAGYMVPLELFPAWVRALSEWLPFRYMLAFPVELMTGQQSVAHAFGQLARQWLFAAAGVLGCWALWRAGSRRYQAYGG